MPDGLIDTAVQLIMPSERRIYGVVIAEVIDNVDLTCLGRVQIRFPWLPGVEPWARVAVLSAGPDRGTFFIPQEGDEVLVAFNHGDISEPYIIGSLWNGQDRPPASFPTDATTKRIIRTPQEQEIELDDEAESITITSSTQQKITIDPEKIEITTTNGAAKLKLDKDGNVSIEAAQSIQFKAPTITIEGRTKVDIKSGARASINGGQSCSIRAGVVTIN